MSKVSIVIVEDDEITALNLSMSLKKHGYDIVATCDNINDAKSEIDTLKPNIVIIDISLQDTTDGIILAQYVKKNYNIPFIYITSHSDDNIIAQAKLTEPYGYIVKPFDPSSLHATIQMAIFKFDMLKEKKEQRDTRAPRTANVNLDTLLYTRRASDAPIINFGYDYHLDPKVGETFYKGQKIKLTKKENAFLRLLVAKLNQVVSFKEATDYIWDEYGATENSVRTLVWRLRNKLEAGIIKNASGIGYYIEK